MLNRYHFMMVFLSLFICSQFANAAEYKVSQKGKDFSVHNLAVKVGDTVHFVNEDNFFHNVFSLSETKFFDLGSYPKDESKSVTFDQAGTVEVECAIHPNMIMTIEVTP